MAKRMVVFGYSITYGAWDTKGGWVARLRKHLDEKALEGGLENYWLIYNLGISAETIDQLLSRFESEAKRRLVRKEDIVILAPGNNDSLFIPSMNKTAMSTNKLSTRISSLVDKATQISSNVIFLGTTPVDSSKTNPWKPDKVYRNKFIEQSNAIIRKECVNKNIDYIDLYTLFKQSNYKNLLQDGLHPNTKGHELIFETVLDYLQKEKIVE